MESRGKTIFLVVHSGFGARYLLRTDILRTLKESGARIVVLTSNADETYFRQEFEDRSVIVERLEVEKCTAYHNRSRVQQLLHTVRQHTLNGGHDVSTIRDHRRLFEQTHRPSGLASKVSFAAAKQLMDLLPHSRWLRRSLVRGESGLYRGHFHRPLFEKYRPDLVVTTSLGYWHPDEYVMREAKAHGALVVQVILSWDNTSSKGMAGAQADYVIAWTEAMKRELVAYHDIDPRQVFVGGVAHFDLYHRPDELWSREVLFGRMGLDLDRRLILFATKSPNNYPWTPDIIRVLAEAIAGERFVDLCQLLVRLHPIHFRRKKGELVFQAVLDEYQRLCAEFPFVHLDIPEIVSEKLPLDAPRSEMVKLGSLLCHADVLVNSFSTVALEASLFDLPIVHVAFEGDRGRATKPRHSIKIDEVQVHNQRVIGTGGARVAYTEDQLLDQINAYLTDPSLDSEGRALICSQECGPNQGEAGVAIAAHMLSLLGIQSHVGCSDGTGAR